MVKQDRDRPVRKSFVLRFSEELHQELSDANNFIKSMRALLTGGVENKMVVIDPTKGIKLLRGPNDDIGHHTWTQEELDRFEARWPVGTRERLAYDLLLYTGLRRGDAVRVGRQHVRDDLITIRTEKHRKGKPGEMISIPILPPLAASIAATKTGDMKLPRN